ncbi:MAG: hypothetical protein AAF108_04145 [Planctomycetota bacterium]
MGEQGSTEKESRRELLLSRVTDGEASDAEFDELRTLASLEPSVWRDLAEGQRAASLVASVVDAAGSVADGVAAPAYEHASVRVESRLSSFGRGVWRNTGWLAAAAVVLLWSTTGGRLPGASELPATGGPSIGAGGEASFVPVSTASQALDRYLDLGRAEGVVLGEMPTGRVLERRPSVDGSGFEVIFLRQIVERAIVEDVYELARDEAGNATPIRLTVPETAGVH